MKQRKPTDTIRDLQQEISSLREGLNKTAGALATAMVELEEAKARVSWYQLTVTSLEGRLFRQQQYRTRAHETIELLVQKMPYPVKP